MATVNLIEEVETALRKRLNLESPRFVLDDLNQVVSGSIISPSFAGQDDLQRQQWVWQALEAEWGEKAVDKVGALLCYTPHEWDIDIEGLQDAG